MIRLVDKNVRNLYNEYMMYIVYAWFKALGMNIHSVQMHHLVVRLCGISSMMFFWHDVRSSKVQRSLQACCWFWPAFFHAFLQDLVHFEKQGPSKKSKKSINMIEYEAFPYTPIFGFDWYIITLLAGMYRKMERCWEICQLPKAAGRYQLLQKNATGRWTQVKQVTLLLNGGFLTKFVGSFFCQEILVFLVIILYSFFLKHVSSW